MILRASTCLAMIAGMVATVSPVSADVLEVDADGARWIAGGTSAVPATDPGIEAVELTADYVVPAAAVADASRQAVYVPATYAATIENLARRFDLSPALLEAVVWQESRWRENAVSPVGARGLAQLMPGTARYLGVDADNPSANLEGGARYLREQLDRFDGDLERALAAYNAGPGRVERAGGIPNIRETKQYVAAIMGRLADHSRTVNQ